MKLCVNNIFFTSTFFGLFSVVSSEIIAQNGKAQPFPSHINNLEQQTAPNQCINGKKWVSVKEYYETNEEVEGIESILNEMSTPTYFSKEKDWVKVCQKFEIEEDKSDESKMELSNLPIDRQTSSCKNQCYSCCGCTNTCRPVVQPPPKDKPPSRSSSAKNGCSSCGGCKSQNNKGNSHKSPSKSKKDNNQKQKNKNSAQKNKSPCARYLRSNNVEKEESETTQVDYTFICHNWKQVQCDGP